MKKAIRIWLIIFILISSSLHAQTINENDYYQRLFYLCKAWGHAKYFHSEICQGTVHWDDALLNAVKYAKESASDKEFNDSLFLIFTSAGETVKGTMPLPEVEDSLNNITDLSWTHSQFFSDSMRALLDTITSRISWHTNYYVIPIGSVGNPNFVRDSLYTITPSFPTEDLRLLALFRYWNAINYFFPYKNIMDIDWDTTLKDMIPLFVNSKDSLEYVLNLRKLLNRIDDSHGFLNSSIYSSWDGNKYPPFEARQIENEMVITKVLPEVSDLNVGDVIKEIDGFDIYKLKDSLRQYSYGSNDVIIERNLINIVMKNDSGTYPIKVFNGVTTKETTFLRNSDNYSKLSENNSPVWRDTVLGDGCRFGIIDMERLEPNDVPLMFEDLWDADALVFDIRNYPLGTLWVIVDFIFRYPINVANFTVPDLNYPGRFYWHEEYIGNGTGEPYSGIIIMLFDERTQSQAEYTCMGLEQHKNSIKIGSQTAAADGNVSYVFLPGRNYAYFTGLGTFYSDYTPTQRIGIVPDIEVKPTIEGIRAGRDEVLERALDCSLLVDVKESNLTDNFKIYPNPFINSVRFSLPDDMKNASVRFEITDLLGRCRMILGDFEAQGELELNNLENGTYILKAISSTKTVSRILIKY